jgi:hypothetical protein
MSRRDHTSSPLGPARLAALTRFVATEAANGKYPFVEFDVNARWHQRIYRDPTVDIWLIGWLPSQGTQLHDHGGSGGSFTVVSGELAETVYVRSGAGVGRLHEHSRAVGHSVAFDSGYVHDVRNRGDAPAISVHAYSRPLTAMTCYDLDDGGLKRGASVATDDPEPALEIRVAS